MAARVISADPAERASWEAHTSGYIIHGLRLAVHGLLDVGSFDEAVLAIANLGGDADTNAAIYGQLGGAYFGVEAIPASWRSTLYQGEEIAHWPEPSWTCAWRHRSRASTRTCRARCPPPDGSPDASHPHPHPTITQKCRT